MNESKADTSLRIPRMNSLLVIKPSSLGDIVHGLQVMQIVARAHPKLRISWVVRERFAPLVKAAPFVAETIIFRRRDGWPAFIKLIRELRGRKFDAVWDAGAASIGVDDGCSQSTAEVGSTGCA